MKRDRIKPIRRALDEIGEEHIIASPEKCCARCLWYALVEGVCCAPMSGHLGARMTGSDSCAMWEERTDGTEGYKADPMEVT